MVDIATRAITFDQELQPESSQDPGEIGQVKAWHRILDVAM